MLRRKIKTGPFKGRTIIAETEGSTREVRCMTCGHKFTATFFRKEPKANDASLCPKCGATKEFQFLPKVIYTITTMKFGWFTMIRGKNKGKKIYKILDERVVGWFETKEMAIAEVLNNSGDIYECGSYPTAVVEEIPMGLYVYSEKSWWFHWRRKIGYKPSRKPKSYKRVFGFAMG